MSDNKQTHGGQSVADFDAIAPVEGGNHRRCACCGGPFGLIRHRKVGRQFCSTDCVVNYVNDLRSSIEWDNAWLKFLYRPCPD